MAEMKAILTRYLDSQRNALLWKLDGLGEYDLRRPMVPSGTNLLGLVKHVAAVESDYFGNVFGRPFPDPQPWMAEDAEPNADMWVTPEESTASILDLYARVREHAAETIAALDVDSPGVVPWWGEHGDVTLGWILVHVATEVARHAGHADIVREQIDGAIGLRDGVSNLPEEGNVAWWSGYTARVEAGAQEAAGVRDAGPQNTA
ncbi:DinB family protein [Occultella glacieicola]|uniref:DinB family protein n=1 Tax=Occultella glacieicola TaxID=2518684 RepID=A0ABY2E467_9MICO|nr:DinB family protein [Occultella glacieicola]TDE93900.1 DinB family protein [Occultella glacieicola]